MLSSDACCVLLFDQDKISMELSNSDAEFTTKVAMDNVFKFATLCNDDILENFFYKVALEQPPLDLRTRRLVSNASKCDTRWK